MESTGQAKAEAQSRAEAARIEGEAAVQQAKLKAQASTIEAVRNYYLVCKSKSKLFTKAVNFFCTCFSFDQGLSPSLSKANRNMKFDCKKSSLTFSVRLGIVIATT